MTSKWKEKKKAKKASEEKERIRLEEEERQRLAVEKGKNRIRLYNHVYRKAHLAETAARQRRWRAKKRTLTNNAIG